MAAKKYVCKICGYTHEGDSVPAACPLCKAGSDQFEAVAEAGAEQAEKPKKKGLDTNSDLYAIIYSAVVVVIVAFLLAGVSSLLKQKQDDNITLDKKKQILASLNIKNVADVALEYDNVIKGDPIINVKGEVVKENGGFKVANDAVAEANLPLYIAEVNGEKKYIIPMTGNGLWGGIWGYLALNDDCNTIYGVYFSHASETPGLGAEIATDMFQSRFLGKHVLKDGSVALSVVKKVKDETVEVNAISGATITCNGVDGMLKTKIEPYKTYLLSNTNVEPATAEAEAQVNEEE